MLDLPAVDLEGLRSTWQDGGSVMPALALAAVLLWYTVGVRLVLVRRGDHRPLDLLVGAHVKALGSGAPLPASGVVGTAAARAARVMAQPTGDIRHRLEALFGDLRRDLGRGATLLHSVCLIAPLLGLLGTVGGMMETFDSLAEMALYSQGGGVAGGVAQALLTTQVGLVIAIPGILAERLLNKRQLQLESELDELLDVVPQLTGGPEITGVPEITGARS